MKSVIVTYQQFLSAVRNGFSPTKMQLKIIVVGQKATTVPLNKIRHSQVLAFLGETVFDDKTGLNFGSMSCSKVPHLLCRRIGSDDPLTILDEAGSGFWLVGFWVPFPLPLLWAPTCSALLDPVLAGATLLLPTAPETVSSFRLVWLAILCFVGAGSTFAAKILTSTVKTPSEIYLHSNSLSYLASLRIRIAAAAYSWKTIRNNFAHSIVLDNLSSLQERDITLEFDSCNLFLFGPLWAFLCKGRMIVRAICTIGFVVKICFQMSLLTT